MAKIHLKNEDLFKLEKALIAKASVSGGVITSLDLDSVADEVLPVAKRPTRQTLIKFLNDFESFEPAEDLGKRPLHFRLLRQEPHEPEEPSTNATEAIRSESVATQRFGIDNPVFLSGEQVLLVLTPAEFVRIQSMLQRERDAGA